MRVQNYYRHFYEIAQTVRIRYTEQLLHAFGITFATVPVFCGLFPLVNRSYSSDMSCALGTLTHAYTGPFDWIRQLLGLEYVDINIVCEVVQKFVKMTAHDQIRAMLDQLMGTGRNGEYSVVVPYNFQCKFDVSLQYIQTETTS